MLETADRQWRTMKGKWWKKLMENEIKLMENEIKLMENEGTLKEHDGKTNGKWWSN